MARNRITGLRYVPAKELRENPRNWRTHNDAQRGALRGVLAEVGIADAMLAYETPEGLMLIDGHLRTELLSEESQVPVLVLDVNESEANKLLATIDPLAGMAGTDAAKIGDLIGKIDTQSDALQKLLQGLASSRKEFAQDEATPEPEEEPITQPGDLWILGDHRLLCGDAEKAADVSRLLGQATPNIMVTDPPYGVKLDQTWRDGLVNNFNSNANIVLKDDKADWTEAWRLFTGNVAYVWHASQFSDVVTESLRKVGLMPVQQLVWNKTVMVMGRNDYHWKHEPCWYAVRKGSTHHWIGDRKQTTVIDAASPAKSGGGSNEEKTPHPTQKPIECMAYPMKNHSGDVYDPFMGSGTTLMAAQQLGRRCFGMELSPKYVDIIVARWETFTGEVATRGD